MATPRQIKIYEGSAPSGSYLDDPITDSLGNAWIQAGGSAQTGSAFTVWYTPNGGGNTVGGACTFRGVTFDHAVLSNALLIAVSLRVPPVETHLILFEFGARADTFAFDIGYGSAFNSGSVTSGQMASSTTNILGNALSNQVWIAVNATGIDVTASAPAGDYTLVVDSPRLRAYYRYANSALPSPNGAYTYSPATRNIAQVMRFDDVGDVVPLPVYLPVPSNSPQAINTCNPQTTVSNGGKGNAGCNTGGVGWTRSYTGPWGAVPQHADPTDGELLTGKESKGIEAWIELKHVDYPSEAVTTYRRAMIPLAHHPDKDGYKTDGLLAIGDVEHALGNEQGGLEAATVNLEFTDVRDRFFRNLLVDQELEGDELYIKLSSDPAAEDAA